MVSRVKTRDKKEEPVASPVCVGKLDMTDVDLAAPLCAGRGEQHLPLPPPLSPRLVGVGRRAATAVCARRSSGDRSRGSSRAATNPERPDGAETGQGPAGERQSHGSGPGRPSAPVTPRGTARVGSERGASHTDSYSSSENEIEGKAAAATLVRRKRGKAAREAMETPDPVAKHTRSKKEESEREESAIQAPLG